MVDIVRRLKPSMRVQVNLKLLTRRCQWLHADCDEISVLVSAQGVRSLGHQCTPHGCLVWYLADVCLFCGDNAPSEDDSSHVFFGRYALRHPY